MKKLNWIGLLIIMALLLVGCGDKDRDQNNTHTENTDLEEQVNDEATNEPVVEDQEIIEYAQTFVRQLSEGEYEEATERFDDTMSEQVTPEALNEIWTTLQTQVGNYIDQEYKSTEEADGYQIILITGIFNNTDVIFRVTFNEEQQIAGFFVQ